MLNPETRNPKTNRPTRLAWPRLADFVVAAMAIGCLGFAASARAAGTGLTGDYYATSDFTGTKSTRVDATVNFDWAAGSPGFGGLGTNNYSVRWSGQLEPRYDETYTFYVTADDGATLWVNDRLIVSRLLAATPAQMAGQIALQANQRVNLRLEFIEKTNNASIRLEWASATQAREVVPQSQLYPATMAPERGSILREHWANLSGTAITNLTSLTNYPSRPDGREVFLSFESLQQNWATNVGTRLCGYLLPQTNGVYTFAVAASDTAELWISPDLNPANKQRIASVATATAFRDWSNQVSQISIGRTLVAWQKYYIELLHKAGTNNQHFSVAWQPPGATQFTVLGADYLIPAGLTNSLPAQTNILNTLAASHPRLLATAERFAWLRQQVATNPAGQPAQWYSSLYRSATNLFTAAPVVYAQDNRGTILDQSRTVKDRMYLLGLAWKISGDTNFPERAWVELNAAGNFPDWHPPHFLDTAEMTHGFAIAYDWFYEYWTSTRRTFILTNITTKGLTAGLKEFTNNVGWSKSTGNNWNMVCNGGLTLGALAVGTDAETTAEQMLTKTVPSQAAVMQHWTADNGGWYEGPGYWDYATDYNFRMLAGLQSALGTDFGISNTNGLNNAGLFAMLLTSANKRNFNFADTGGAGVSGGPQMFWWARRFNVPAYARYERTNNTADVMNALWWDGRGGDPVSEGIGSDILFLGPTGTTPFDPQHVGVFRSSWGDPSETMLAFKGGEMGASHGDLDAGDFVIEALGQRWAWDLGSDDYALPGYFDSNPASATNRWDYYRMRAEGQNTVVINPGNGPDTALGPVAPVTVFQSKAGVRSLSVMDLTPVETGVTRAWRGFQLFGPQRKQVLVQDEIVASTAANVWWFMHYQSTTISVEVSPDGTSVTMTQGVNRLWGKILSGGGSFQIMNAHPLPTSPDPTGQNLNASYQKLAIHLTGVTNTTIAVWFVPLAPGQNPPLVAPTITPLAQWVIPQDDPPIAADGNLTTPQNTAVDVDLTTLASDTSTPASNLVFTVSNATNGTAALLPDGHTARFTPAAGFYGTGQYLYTVTDSATNSTTAGVVVKVLPATWYWDTSTAAGLQPGNGTWDGATASWSSVSSGSNPLLAWPALGNDAVFLGSGGSYSVTINNTQRVNQITTTNGTWTLAGGALVHPNGALTIIAEADTTLNSPLTADTDFNKLGANRLTLGAPAIFSGDVFVPNGTLRSTTNNALPVAASVWLGANTTAGALDFASGSQTLSSLAVVTTNSTLTNAISIGTGQTLKIAGTVTVGIDNGSVGTTRMRMSGGGALLVTNTAQNFTVGVSVGIANTSTNGNTASLDCSKLGSVTLGTASAPLGELRVGYGNGSGSTTHGLTLSDTNNSITATTVQVGNSMGANGSAGTLMLGSGTNLIVADTLNIGLAKVGGTVKFASQTAGSPGTVTIRGKTGLATAIWVGYKNGAGTAASPTSTLDLRGHNATITASSLSVGIENGSSTGGDSGSLYFDGGVFTVTNVTIGAKSATSTGTANGSLYISGGTFTVCEGGSFTLASQATTSTASGTLNLTGGAFNSYADILDGGGTNTSTITLNGGKLNMFGHSLGSSTKINTLNFQSGTLQNVGEINAGSPLVKTGAGLLVLGGTNGFTGGTVVTAGTLQLAGNLASSLTVSNGVLTGSGTVASNLTLTTGATFQPRLNGYLAGTNYDQLVVARTVTLAGALSVSVTNAGALPAGYTFTIIRNDSASPVSGSFAGLPQLATFTNSPLAWRINYQGGNGNDVTLTLLSGGAVMPPSVVLTAPTNGATVGLPFNLAATASSPWGIAAVDFYAGALYLGSDSNAPYALALNQVLPGPHTFTAVARDNSGLSTTSASVAVSIVGSVPAAPQLSGPSLVGGKPTIQINGPAGYYYFVDVSTNLTVWTSVFATNAPPLPFAWQDADTNTFAQRFYRVRLGP